MHKILHEVIRIRRYSLIAFIVLTFSLQFILISSAFAVDEAVSLQNQIQSLSRNLNDVTGKYNNSLDRLEHLKDEISVTEQKIKYSEEQAKKYQEFYSDRLDGLYRYGQVNMVDVLLSAESIDDFIVRFEYISRIGKKDKANSDKFVAAAKEYNAAKKKLDGQKAEQQKLTNTLAGQRSELEQKLDAQKDLLAKLEAERKRASAAQGSGSRSSRRSVSYSGASSVQSINGFAFPVISNHSYSNDWGNPRSGGRRHQGTDIFAPHGSPAFAVVSGTIKNQNSGLGGLMVYLYGDDGNTYLYCHMSQYLLSSGTRVSAGQVIASVGNSGNARGGSAHVHFEVHPGGGGPTNPYPILRNADPNFN